MDWGHLARLVRALGVGALDAVLPPHIHTRRTKMRGFDEIPLHTAIHMLLGAPITTLMDYRKPEVLDLVRSLKFDGNEHAAHLCAAVLADFLREEIASLRAYSPRPIFIVPVPLHPARQRERGYNQISLVLDHLPRDLRDGTRSMVTHMALIRTRDTPHQMTLPRRERLRNVRSAFAVSDPLLLRHTHIFLVDDVTTTGASLVSAGKALEKAQANVTLLALARA